MRAYVIAANCRSLDDLKLIEQAPLPLGHGQIRLKLRAVTLNSRDQQILEGRYILFRPARQIVPLSDGAGEIVEVGTGVSRWKVGDRVVATFFQPLRAGLEDAMPQQLGGPLDGVLRDEIVLDQDGVLPIPGDLSFAEAAALPCAALTAWCAVMEAGGTVGPGDTVLVLGTGGVSIFGLQFGRAAGARVIVTSSSDEKIARAIALGAAAGVNYRTHPDWHTEVRRLTGGRGADCILEVGGFGTLASSIEVLAPHGRIGLIGGLAGAAKADNIYALRASRGSIHGIAVGPRDMHLRMHRTIVAHRIKPVIDRVIPFERAADAFRLQASGAFFGKIAVSIP